MKTVYVPFTQPLLGKTHLPIDGERSLVFHSLSRLFLWSLLAVTSLLSTQKAVAQCYYENFESGTATGWSNPAVSCGTGFGCFLGRFSHTQGNENSLVDMLETQKTFDFSSTTGDITIKFQLNEIDYNDPNNWWSVRLNGTTIIRNQYNGPYGQGGYGGFGSTSWDPPVSGSTTTPFGVVDWTITPMTYQDGNNPSSQNYGFNSKSDQKHQVTMVIHNPTTSSITMAFYDMLDQGVNDESFGYDNIYLCRGGNCTCNSTAPAADLSVVKSGPATVLPNGSITYSFVVTNNGPTDASGATVMDASVANFTQGSVTCSGANCPGGYAAGVVSLANLQKGAIPLFTFPAGSSVTFTVTGTAAASGTIVNTATVTAPPSVYDGNTTNNSSSVTTVIGLPSTDLQVVKTGTTSVSPNGTVTYNLVVTNNGPLAANGATVSDPAVANFTAGSIACSGATGSAVCPTTPTLATLQAGTLSIPTLPSGGSVTFTITGPAGSSAGTITNTATVTPPAGITDSNPANNTSTATTTIASTTVDLQLVKTGPASVAANGTVTYSLVITNNGPAAANGATISDPSVANFTQGTITCTGTTGGAGCPVNPTVAALQAGSISIPALPSGGTVTLTVTGTAGSSAGTITNIASVNAPAGLTDPNQGNNTGVAVTNITVATSTNADLAVTKTGSATASVNSTVTYTILIQNNGPAAANGALINDPAVANFTLNSVSCGSVTGGAVCPTTPTAAALQTGTLTIPTLPSGGSVLLTLVGQATGGGSITNTVTVSPPAGVSDPNFGNNSSSAITTVCGVPSGAVPTFK